MDKIRIARYACENGNSKAVSKFKSDFPKLNEIANARQGNIPSLDPEIQRVHYN